MGFLESIRLSFSSLASNKMRSLLTMLGIIIGISAVITITTIGNSIQQTLSNTFNQFGMNMFYVMITNKYTETDEENDDEASYEDEYVELTDDDMISDDMINELFETYPGEFKLAMEEYYSEAETINNQNQYINVNISGITDGYLEQGKIKLLMGRNISQRDNKEKKHTAVVSDIFVKQYFSDGTNPLGQTVSFTMASGESQDFTVVGVYEYSESKMGAFTPGIKDEDKITPQFIPFNTALKLKGDSDHKYTYAVIMWDTSIDMATAETHITEFFDEQYEHNKHWQVYIENEQSMVDMINKVLGIITIAISVIAAISLIVGGVGVMNIMLVSIVERTKEIGIRKALGAQNSSIRLQFVTESIIICLIGGIIGIITGILNGVIIGKAASVLVEQIYTDYKDLITVSVSPSLSAIIIAVVFSMLTGIFFGYYPANKAAKMNPIDALRYE
jgi:putative ABC transport system permease protein